MALILKSEPYIVWLGTEYLHWIYERSVYSPRRSGETIQKSAIPPTANQRTFHITTNPIACDIVARNKHVYFGQTMELGVSFQILNILRMH